jgi:sugar/nucleoside kinase (ribokinase family)
VDGRALARHQQQLEANDMPQIIATVGEILVEFVSHVKDCGLERIGEYSGPYPSGAPAIFLDQAARMGACTEMFGGVGNDGFGRSVLNRLRDDGVGTDGVSVLDNRSTGTAFVSYYGNGSRDFIFHLTGTAADGFMIKSDTVLSQAIILHVSASSLGNANMRQHILQAVRQVSEAGGTITCDPNARPELMQDAEAWSALREVVEQSSILMPSTSDLGHLFPGLSEDEAVKHLLGATADIVVIKRGNKGATIARKGERIDVERHVVDEVDPTGAGDCFCGTFVSLLAQGMSHRDAGIRANAAGAIAVTRRGPMEGNSTPQEISAFLAAPKTTNATRQEKTRV